MGKAAKACSKTGRRGFLRKSAVSTAAAAAIAASGFPKPSLAQGLKKWRMGTTWPKNFPASGT
ncbi:MAG: twin-arginine translocation signal domain-containing protein, partial [Rhodospirillales bacterium]|nr:twin-arginine translocation signal domain-containing protein [Rhodospirillales bacterium]